jgi:hypothetical protein
MTPIEELSDLISGPGRAIVIASGDVDLARLGGTNELFVLKLTEGSLAAGGRGGGFGERKVVRVCRFRYSDGNCEKTFETADEAKAGRFEVPYYVARLPITMRDGAEGMGYGVVDPELVGQFGELALSLS